jgi:hypothetical protein
VRDDKKQAIRELVECVLAGSVGEATANDDAVYLLISTDKCADPVMRAIRSSLGYFIDDIYNTVMKYERWDSSGDAMIDAEERWGPEVADCLITALVKEGVLDDPWESVEDDGPDDED